MWQAPYMDIELSVKDVGDVESSIRKYVTPEVLSGDNQWEYKEGVKVDAIKGLKLHTVPPVLTLQLKR